MTRDDIIELALQCGIWIPLASGPERERTIERLRRFAALVAAAERAAVRHEADCVEACKSEIERLRAENVGLVDDMNLLRDNNAALRARIEAMERQEPVWWQTRTRPTWNDGTWGQWRKCSEEYAQDIKKTPLLHDWLYEARALYALPGAQTQPAPSVPTALLVAVADLVAQMEIVSRVGFVDTPNDKDSCAAFCVAEGTWLELVKCVETLAASLAALEAKP